jgi:hypothetical protein
MVALCEYRVRLHSDDRPWEHPVVLDHGPQTPAI